MNIIENKKLNYALNKANRVLKVVRSSGQSELANELEEIIKAAKSQKFVIGVVGSAKRGKSTLINGLLGQSTDSVAPIGKFPATNVISLFGYGEQTSVKVVFTDGRCQSITESEIRKYVTEEHNKDNCKQVRSVEVVKPFDGLEQNVYLVDTPGANNALSERHGEILLDFLPAADAVIFMVTADMPITAAEQKLLKAIHGEQTHKLFFAVNKVDLIESGDMTQEELAEGVDHNRRILSNSGFPDARIYEVSAKNYFEKKNDSGMHGLILDVRAMIEKEKVDVMVGRINERVHTILNQCREKLTLSLIEAKSSDADINKELNQLAKFKSQLKVDAPQREREFSDAWDDAFQSLDQSLIKITKELVAEYGQLIENVSASKIEAYAQTIHADIQVGFVERIKPEMIRCEESINSAIEGLQKSVESVVIKVCPEISPGTTVSDMLADGGKVGLAAMPAIATGVVAASLPGLVGSAISAAAPASAGFWTSVTGGVVGATGTAATTALSAIALPFAGAAFIYAGFRFIQAWKSNVNKQKNLLNVNVGKMIDEGFEQVRGQICQYKKQKSKILQQFNEQIYGCIENADNRLVELKSNRPTDAQIKQIEENKLILDKEVQSWNCEEFNEKCARASLTDSLISDSTN